MRTLSTFVLLVAVGCATDPNTVDGDLVSAGKGDDSGALALGTYKMASDGITGELTITSVRNGRVAFELFAIRTTGGGSHGWISGEFLSGEAGAYAFDQGDDCTIGFGYEGSTISLEQVGTCAEAGFGAFVDATGDYELVKPVAVGTYKMDTAAMSGDLTIKSVREGRVAFELFVMRTTGSGNHGWITGEFLSGEAGAYAFDQGEDCTIGFSHAGNTISLEQVGTCSEAGFGAFVNATGDYLRKEGSDRSDPY
jgi:hypothetical protein